MEFLCDGIDEGAQVARPAMGIPMTSLNLISQFCIIFDAILPRTESPHEDEIIQCCLIQVIWPIIFWLDTYIIINIQIKIICCFRVDIVQIVRCAINF